MNEEFNNQNHDEENFDVEQDTELEHRHTEEPQKQSIIKSIWNHKIMMAIRRILEKISCHEATFSDDANGSNTVYGIFSLFRKDNRCEWITCWDGPSDGSI